MLVASPARSIFILPPLRAVRILIGTRPEDDRTVDQQGQNHVRNNEPRRDLKTRAQHNHNGDGNANCPQEGSVFVLYLSFHGCDSGPGASTTKTRSNWPVLKADFRSLLVSASSSLLSGVRCRSASILVRQLPAAYRPKFMSRNKQEDDKEYKSHKKPNRRIHHCLLDGLLFLHRLSLWIQYSTLVPAKGDEKIIFSARRADAARGKTARHIHSLIDRQRQTHRITKERACTTVLMPVATAII